MAIMKQTKIEQDPLSELQLRGKGGDDPVDKLVRDAEGLAGGTRPGITKRSERNRLNSKTNRPPVDPARAMAARVAEKTAGKGAQNDNFGQPRNEDEDKLAPQLSEFLSAVRGGTISEQFLSEIQPELLLGVLRSLRSRCLGGWSENNGALVNESGYVADPTKWKIQDGSLQHISGQHIDFDLVCDAISVLESASLVNENKELEVGNLDEVELFNELVLKKLGL